jgi:signal transduction histidine kinase
VQHLLGDKKIKDEVGGAIKKEIIQAHDGPIWQLAWAHPE